MPRDSRKTLLREIASLEKRLGHAVDKRDREMKNSLTLRIELERCKDAARNRQPSPTTDDAHLFFLTFTALAELLEGRALGIETKTGEQIQEYVTMREHAHVLRASVAQYATAGSGRPAAFEAIIDAISEGP